VWIILFTTVGLGGLGFYDDYLKVAGFKNFPGTELTAAFWMRSSDTVKAGTPISYTTSASDNTLEVEHILEAAALRVEGLPELLEELATAIGWADASHLPDGTHVVPLARWARVASAYCREGVPGLRSVLISPGHESFVLALLEELHSAEAVDLILDFFLDCIHSPADDPALARKIASSLNLILCCKPQVQIAPAVREQVRTFATQTIELASDQVERAIPVFLLRAVGDEYSLDMLDALPPFTDAWEDTIPTTKRAIRKRLRKTSG
jgi:hypothetical protein